MIEIIITPSKKSDKKFDAVIDGKNRIIWSKGVLRFYPTQGPSKKTTVFESP